MYQGTFVNDVLEGHGVCRYVNKGVFEGLWSRGYPLFGFNKFEPKFAQAKLPLSTYEGRFITHGNSNGGRITYENGDVYEGQLASWKRDGLGTLTYAASSTAVSGLWRKGAM